MGNPLLDTRVTDNSLRRARIHGHQKWKWIPLITCIYILFLGAYTKLRKETISFVMSVCLSVRIEQLVSH